MLTYSDLHSYQLTIADHIVKNKESFPMVDMGLGKTISTLTAINTLMYQDMEVQRVLIIAPKKIAETVWSDEIHKWTHVKHLTISRVIGSDKERKMALMKRADIYIIGRDNVQWLQALYGMAWPFDMLVIDESSSFKNHQAKRFKALKIIRPLIKRVVLLSGTPVPNGLMDLWPQLYLLDMGQRLGKFITYYRDNYFSRKFSGHGYEIRKGVEAEIYDKIKDISISMKTEDYLELPERIDNFIKINLPNDVLKKYQQFERDAVLTLQQEKEITAVNAGVLTNKLAQCSSGAVYDENGNWYEFHAEKLNALAEIIEAAQGRPVLIFYWFKHDLERIKKAFRNCRELKGAKEVADWNAGKIDLLAAHPMSAGHGLNLQHGGEIAVWFSNTFGLEFYQQACKRLHRQGQKRTTIIHHLICIDTMDEIIMEAIETKANAQNALLSAVSALDRKYSKNNSEIIW